MDFGSTADWSERKATSPSRSPSPSEIHAQLLAAAASADPTPAVPVLDTPWSILNGNVGTNGIPSTAIPSKPSAIPKPPAPAAASKATRAMLDPIFESIAHAVQIPEGITWLVGDVADTKHTATPRELAMYSGLRVGLDG